MADTAAQQDNKSESMEEILQSIKRIMDDESDGDKKTAAEEDVFDLTNVMEEDKPAEATAEAAPAPVKASSPAPAPTPAPVPPPAPAPTPALAASASAEEPIAPSEPPPVSVEKVATFVSKEQDVLISEQAASAAAVSFRKIAGASQKDYSIPHIPSLGLRSGTTVEDLMLEAIRPMLKEWLDQNLPVIVQKIVEKEIKRIVSLHYD